MGGLGETIGGPSFLALSRINEVCAGTKKSDKSGEKYKGSKKKKRSL